MRVSAFLLACLFTGQARAAGPAASEIARQIENMGLDAGQCYRVIDLQFAKQDLRIYLTSGYLIFSKPVNGLVTGAVFTADVEAGDAEMLLLPPLRSERLSLASFIESPNLNEHFASALMLFTDGTGEELAAKLKASEAKRKPEMGALLEEKWSRTMANVASSFQVRLAEDALDRKPEAGVFYMTVGGAKPGNFDVYYDAAAEENLIVGQLVQQKTASYFNVWTSLRSKARSEGRPSRPELGIDNYRIEATLDPGLKMQAVTRFTAESNQAMGRAVAFSISQAMRVTEAKVDGEPAEVLQRESLRSNLIHANGNQDFLVVTAKELEPGKPHEFEIRHEGNVIVSAGDQVYYVNSRGTWYPRHGMEFARYDLTFRYPKGLSLVANGDAVEDKTEGETRVTRYKSSSRMRFVGFNLGNYKSIAITHGDYRVVVYANRSLETALQPRRGGMDALPPLGRRRSLEGAPPEALAPPAPPDPMGRLNELAGDVASALDFMTAQFGPPPLKTLTVSPIPGAFGQGFPGLLYVSTLAYMDPAQRPLRSNNRSEQMFFSEVLDAHEVAHQWWGNLVVPASYQDAWLMEALANYSALLFIEKKKGGNAMEVLLDDYRAHLLSKAPASGKTLESAGPITWGYRLQSSLSPEAWHAITYEKGTWVVHMLRRRMGDERFLAMLHAMCERYRYKTITTEQFRQLALEFLTPGGPDTDLSGFFENWVYGTGIPAVKLTYVARGLKVTGSVTQSDVSDDFTARIPIEVVTGRQRTLYWLATGSEPVPFTIALKAPAAKVSLAVKDALMTAKR